MELRKSYDCMISTSRPSRLALFVVEKWPSLPRAAAVPRVYEISYIGGVHVKAGVMALCVTFGLLHKIVPDDSEYLHTQQRTQDYHELT